MKRSSLLAVVLYLSVNSVNSETYWVSNKMNLPGPSGGYATVTYSAIEIGGDTRHDLVCAGHAEKACLWPSGSGYSGPPPLFVPGDQLFHDVNGDVLALTGSQLNQLIWDKYTSGQLNGSIDVGPGLATFTFSLSQDLSENVICQI
ncbi:MAG: hypothetical protein H6606_09735 [Flavobacteriales bacterium]|nr:hypothetical protein [Flavobacteriales bacterium]